MRYSVYGILLFVLAFSALWAYRINYDTREVLSQIQVIRAKIAFEEEKLSMLEGEWAYLNRPQRLGALTEKFFNYLELMPISAANYAKVDAIAIKSGTEFELPTALTILNKSNIVDGDLR